MGIFVEFALPIFKTISILILIVAYLVWLERKVAAKIQQRIQDAGVILRSLPGDSLAFCPPLIIKEIQIHEMFDKIDNVLSEINFKKLW